MISFRLGKQSHVYKLVETVVICFQILTFAVSATAPRLSLQGHPRL